MSGRIVAASNRSSHVLIGCLFACLVCGQFHSRCGMLGRFRPQKQASSVVLCRLAECHALLPAAMVTWYCGVLVLLCWGLDLSVAVHGRQLSWWWCW